MRPRSSWLGLAGVLGIVWATLGTGALPEARAADLDKVAGSLRLIPEDAAFYDTTLRLREQLEAVANSRAWAKLKELPAVQFGWKHLQAHLNQPPLAALVMALHQPENRQLLELLGDMVSHEIFIYGGKNFGDLLDLAAGLSAANRLDRLLLRLAGQDGGADPGKLQIRLLLDALAENVNLVRVPELVVGFKLSKTGQVEPQLQRLEALLKGLFEQDARLRGRLQRGKVSGGDFLTLTLDGSLIPWEQIPWKDVEEKPGQYDELIKKLKQVKLTLSIGTRDGYLLVALGDSIGTMERLGKGKSLAERPEFRPVLRYGDRRLSSIGYVSQALLAKLATSQQDIDNLVSSARAYLPKVELPEEKRKQIEKHLDELARDVKGMIPVVGAQFSFAFLTDRGEESFTYDYGEHTSVESTKPLTLLDHVGGSPLLAAVSRTKYSPGNYQLAVKWLKIAYGYFEEVALARLDEFQKQQYQQLAKIVLPLLQRLDEATGKMLLPSLADGQSAFVLDAKLTSKQWVMMLPATEKPLPLLEVGIVCGLSDAALFRKAFAEYLAVANDAVAKARALVPFIPELKIPAAESKKLKSGTMYYYPLPALLGLDRRLQPNAGLSDTVAVFTLSAEHSDRLLSRSPLRIDGGPLADLKRPMASAVYFDWAGLVSALTPWVEVGLRVGGRQIVAEIPSEALGNAGSNEAKLESLVQQVRIVLDVLKILRSYSSRTYLEGKVLVTHGESIIKDL